MEDQFTEEQLAEYKEGFNLVDKDGDGKIPTYDLNNLMQHFGYNYTEAEIQDIITGIDPECTGIIDFPKFLTLMVEKSKEIPSDELLRDAFHIFDADDNGFIASDELRQIMNNLGYKLTDEEIDDMIREADTDGDGKINYEEFSNLMNPQ